MKIKPAYAKEIKEPIKKNGKTIGYKIMFYHYSNGDKLVGKTHVSTIYKTTAQTGPQTKNNEQN